MSREQGPRAQSGGASASREQGPRVAGMRPSASRSRPPERTSCVLVSIHWFGTILHQGKPVATGELAQATDSVHYYSVSELSEVAA
jgi:hypothetical protein